MVGANPRLQFHTLIVQQDLEAGLSQAGGVPGKCLVDTAHNREVLSCGLWLRQKNLNTRAELWAILKERLTLIVKVLITDWINQGPNYKVLTRKISDFGCEYSKPRIVKSATRGFPGYTTEKEQIEGKVMNCYFYLAVFSWAGGGIIVKKH